MANNLHPAPDLQQSFSFFEHINNVDSIFAFFSELNLAPIVGYNAAYPVDANGNKHQESYVITVYKENALRLVASHPEIEDFYINFNLQQAAANPYFKLDTPQAQENIRNTILSHLDQAKRELNQERAKEINIQARSSSTKDDISINTAPGFPVTNSSRTSVEPSTESATPALFFADAQAKPSLTINEEKLASTSAATNASTGTTKSLSSLLDDNNPEDNSDVLVITAKTEIFTPDADLSSEASPSASEQDSSSHEEVTLKELEEQNAQATATVKSQADASLSYHILIDPLIFDINFKRVEPVFALYREALFTNLREANAIGRLPQNLKNLAELNIPAVSPFQEKQAEAAPAISLNPTSASVATNQVQVNARGEIKLPSAEQGVKTTTVPHDEQGNSSHTADDELNSGVNQADDDLLTDDDLRTRDYRLMDIAIMRLLFNLRELAPTFFYDYLTLSDEDNFINAMFDVIMFTCYDLYPEKFQRLRQYETTAHMIFSTKQLAELLAEMPEFEVGEQMTIAQLFMDLTLAYVEKHGLTA